MSEHPTSQEDRASLRRHFRQQRNALDTAAQTLAANHLLDHLQRLGVLNNSQNVAVYLANDGEIDLQPVIQACWQQHITVCLPIVHPDGSGTLMFQRYQPDSPMTENRFGIPEPKPDSNEIVPLNQLDIIFTPLVAFDDSGNRLGMGGGFYDRTLAPLQQPAQQMQSNLPRVIGVAHDCQQASHLPVESWDIPLSEIVTPTQVFSTR